MIPRTAVLCVAALSVAGPTLAQDASPDSQNGRYVFSKQTDGYVRLDTQTGEVALCSRKVVGFACQAAPEDRALLENEIARLRSENAALKKDILTRGLPLPSGTGPEQAAPPVAQNGAPQGSESAKPQSGGEIDRMVALASRAWRRLLDAVDRAQKQILNKS
jgi:hypothetical protein